jgi:hypothetical protein
MSWVKLYGFGLMLCYFGFMSLNEIERIYSNLCMLIGVVFCVSGVIIGYIDDRNEKRTSKNSNTKR